MASSVITLIETFSQSDSLTIYKEDMLQHVENMGEYIRVILEILKLVPNGELMVEHLIECSAREADNGTERILALTLMTEIWFTFG